MKKLSILLFAISELYPCEVYASSDDEIRSIVKPCIDKIVSSVEGSGDVFTDDDLIKCASDLTRQNNKISISKAIAVVGFYADEAYKMKLQKSAYDDDVKAFAKANGIRPADLKDMINIVNKERDKGGTLEDRERKLEIAREIVDKLGVKK